MMTQIMQNQLDQVKERDVANDSWWEFYENCDTHFLTVNKFKNS